MPDPTPIINEAAKTGWSEALVAFMVVCFIGGIVMLVKAWITNTTTRETRMAMRIDKLEDYIQKELTTMIDQNRKTMEESIQASRTLASALEKRPCLMNK